MYLKDLGSKIMLVTCGEVCYKLTTGGAEEVPELLSTQVEADIRLLLHAAQAAPEGHKAVSSSQMKKKVLCLAFFPTYWCTIVSHVWYKDPHEIC